MRHDTKVLFPCILLATYVHRKHPDPQKKYFHIKLCSFFFLKEGHAEVVRFLAEVGGQNISATYGPLRRTPLHISASNGKTKVVHYLLSKGASVHQLDLDGATALSDAAAKGQLVHFAFTLLQ